MSFIDDFDFPMVYTASHMLASFIGSAILIHGLGAAKTERRHFTDYKWPILILAVIKVLDRKSTRLNSSHW